MDSGLEGKSGKKFRVDLGFGGEAIEDGIFRLRPWKKLFWPYIQVLQVSEA